MIARLRGVLIEKHAPDIVVDVQGVGYELLVPMTTLYTLPAVGEKVSLYTQFIVREDAQLLYGFADTASRSLFRHLIKVNGIGPKLALAIMSGMDVEEFVRCVQIGDTASLVRIPGVGKKSAERLVVEMRDKLSAWQVSGDGAATEPTAAGGNSHIAEAESAMVALGYKPQDASKAISKLDTENLSTEELIRAALKNMIK